MYTLIGIVDTYTKEKTSNAIKRIADNAFIPTDPANTDYQAYLKWLAEGNEPLPAEEQQ